MTVLAEETARRLLSGDLQEGRTIWLAEEILRKCLSSGFESFNDEVNAAPPTSEDYLLIREALYEAFRNADGSRRRALLHVLSRTGDTEIKTALVAELHMALLVHREATGALWNSLLSLQNIGEDVVPQGISGWGIASVELLVRAAESYLQKNGVFVPL